jgi:hypothetical protein
MQRVFQMRYYYIIAQPTCLQTFSLVLCGFKPQKGLVYGQKRQEDGDLLPGSVGSL